MTSNPRLLWVGNFLPARQGMRTVSEDLTRRLAQSGWMAIKVSYRTGRISRVLDIIFTVLYCRQHYDIACVEVYSGMAFFWAEISSMLLTWLNKPLILILHGGGLIEFSNRHGRRVANLLSRGTIVVTPSLFLQKGLTSFSSNIRYLPNGLEMDIYPFRLRKRFGHTLLWLRAFHQTYQPQIAVRVLAELTKEFPDIKLIMIGPDKEDGSLEQVQHDACRLQVNEHLSVIGMVSGSDIPGWLDCADIFLNTTLFESFGVSMMEAAACGLPIVTTNVGEIPFLWQDGCNALLVPTGDVNSMARAIGRILREDTLAASLSHQARQRAEKYDWKIILPQWFRLFRESMKKGNVKG
jgi:glycosyltransferase involved in cell wall biosynthesis